MCEAKQIEPRLKKLGQGAKCPDCGAVLQREDADKGRHGNATHKIYYDCPKCGYTATAHWTNKSGETLFSETTKERMYPENKQAKEDAKLNNLIEKLDLTKSKEAHLTLLGG